MQHGQASPIAIEPKPRHVAFVHDWLNGMRGGEKVLEAMLDVLPDADIYTLLLERDKISPAIAARPITTSFVQRLPLARRIYRYYLPLFPRAVERFDLRGYDLVVSTSHCVAKGARAPDGLHISYIHTPARYLYAFQQEYFGSSPAKRAAMAVFGPHLKRWDLRTLGHVDHFIANSRNVADRIRRYYNRDAAVICPPVDTDFFTPDDGPPADFFLIVSALVPYKRIELAIEAVNRLRLPLVIVGRGPMRAALERLAGPTVSFRGWLSDDEVLSLLRRCRALVFPGEEDFGIVPVEAMACGRPVIAYGRGGALETVVPGETGLFFTEQTVDSLTGALECLGSAAFDPAACRRRAEAFSRERFQREFAGLVSSWVAQYSLDSRV
ncbi:MAG: glycosyltransferase [Verrucomicrobia bacterium]|nr:glycosyltransferase [Verrucomicrobiota bacterium]